MKTVAFIPIKLNSQRLPHKNILPIGNHPLCWYICDTISKVEGIDEVYVYCSDPSVSQYIPDNVKFLKRPKWLDENDIKGYDIYNEFINTVKADVYILAHTTSPFIKVSSIQNALSYVISGKNDSAFSAKRIQTFSWYNGKPINYSLEDVPRTQDISPVWVETSAFYIFKREILSIHHRRIGDNPFIQEVSEMEAIDIDEKEDYELAVMYEKMMEE
ncbi:MAG: acylneuraminate cytidylyltransferase family protein [Lachnospiraceae bacterium]|nr:acylneuraminate cytidylyltransferase family protein [Lachnospiraceae bacterium]